MTKPEPINYLEQLRENWFIIVFIGGVIFAYGNMRNDINTALTNYNKLDVANVALSLKVDASQSDVANISGDIKEIKASLSFIKDRVGK